jgi:hypothetical protein
MRISDEIPDRPNHFFIIHSCCNVMIAEIVDNKIISIEATPVDDGNPEVKAMIHQFYDLIQSNKEVRVNEDDMITIIERPSYVPDYNYNDEDCDNCCENCDGCETETKPEVKQGFFSRLLNKIKSLFGR